MSLETGYYNFYFDICAVAFNIVFLLLISGKKIVIGRRYKYFYYLVLVMLLASLGELCTSLIRDGLWQVSNGAKVAINVLSSFFHNSIGFLLYMYVLHIFGIFRHLTMRIRIMISIPEAVLTIFLVVPTLRKMIFYYDSSGHYCVGRWQNALYWGIILIYGCGAILAVVIYRKHILKNDFISIFIISNAMIGSIMVDKIVNDIHLNISIFLQSVCLMIAYIRLENDSEVIDSETGLLSRVALWNDFSVLNKTNYSAYLILIDINNYDYYSRIVGAKRINDVLKNMASWLIMFADNKVNVYHPEHEKFVLLLYDYSKEDALRLAENIRLRFEKKWDLKDNGVVFQTTVAVTGVPNQISSEGQLYSFVEGSVEKIKSKAKVNFVDEVETDARKLDVEMAITRALENKSLQVYYQPIYDVKSQKIKACEALVRMTDEEIGEIPPEEFIRIAEETGQIGYIGNFVLENVCKFLQKNNPKQYGLEYVEVNMSTIECMNPDILRNIDKIIEKYDVDKNQIDLEITETAVVHNDSVMANVMNALQNSGISFALDDFGTGNANYSYLVNYNFDIIKIDKTFLWAADDNAGNKAVLNSMIQLIQGLNRKAVVEGVETEEQKEYLISKGVDFLQGYHFSKPIPENEFMEYLREFNSTNFESGHGKQVTEEREIDYK
ncbi:MAG: bifunctional diguanylate cyclase/phosphodiesterase [Lachnospiraceae bacterium]|nr:bifunctional diguanylate cyclase/phosphodiesterase [Lachnospiraceae bacterium]